MAIRQLVHSRTGAVVAGATVLVTLGGVGGAVAANTIGSRDIKDGAVKSRDIANGGVHTVDIGGNAVNSKRVQNGTLGMRDLNSYTKDKINEPGPEGPEGPQGPPGPPGTVEYSGPHWSIVDRNVIGAGDAYLRSGPYAANFGLDVEPPLGVGSLGLHTASSQDKVAFGNQVDFVDRRTQNLEILKYSVYTTGENGDGNLPNLQFEIDANLTVLPDDEFTTLSFVPNAVPANQWTEIDATSADAGFWFLTGAEGTATGCTQATTCSWAEVQDALNDGEPNARIYTVQFSKGRDAAFIGAVDKLVIDSETYDFEPFGVIEQ